MNEDFLQVFERVVADRGHSGLILENKFGGCTAGDDWVLSEAVEEPILHLTLSAGEGQNEEWRTLECSASDAKVDLLDGTPWKGVYRRCPIHVCRLDPYVVWLKLDYPGDNFTEPSWFAEGNILAMDGKSYQSAVGSGSWLELPRLPFSKLATRLLGQLLEESVYLIRYSEDALYRDPKRTNDKFGKELLNAIHGFLDSPGDEWVDSEEPTESREIRVYLDRPGLQEFVCRIGEIEGRPVIKFDKYPSFPLWLGGPAIESLMVRCRGYL